MKFGVADYGMNVWDGGNFDTVARLEGLQAIGYEGLERLEAISADDAVAKAVAFRRLGMDFATVRGPQPEVSLQWTAAFGKAYVWTMANGKDFATFTRQTNGQVAACARLGIQVALHNHLGSLVETQDELDAFMAACPGCGLLLDTAHLAAAGGDPIGSVHRYADRLVAIHLKDWLSTNPGAENWWERGRFCELGAGNIGLDNAAVMRALTAVGYDGWIFIEHDTHLRDPFQDLAVSRQYLRDAGY